MRTIAIEEHYTTPKFLEGPGRAVGEDLGGSRSAMGQRTLARLADLDGGRIAEMDAAGIDMQVLSINSPGTEQTDPADVLAVARDANAVLADAIRRHPTRFAGLMALPTAIPDQAASELQRQFGKDGFCGAILNGHCRGRYLDDDFFWPILEAAEALGAPIYMHPTIPPRAVVEASFGGFSPAETMLLAGPAWGWHIETAVHVLRMIARGVFDRFPGLQIVIGHMGEAIPFMMPRLDKITAALSGLSCERKPGDYLRENLHYTFGGFNFDSTFANLLAEVGVDRIMFSVDYPYGSMSDARQFLDRIPVSDADRERIAHGNAEKLLRIKP